MKDSFRKNKDLSGPQMLLISSPFLSASRQRLYSNLDREVRHETSDSGSVKEYFERLCLKDQNYIETTHFMDCKAGGHNGRG